MYIVTLEDGTSCNIDINNLYLAKDVVSYKLKQKLDSRKIKKPLTYTNGYSKKRWYK